MWKKHGVWCQCALTLPIVTAVASIFSCQSLTLYTDLYWSFVFSVSTCVQFLAAEHGPFGMDPHTWQVANEYRMFVVRCVIASWSVLKWRAQHHFVLLIPFCMLAFYLKKHHRIIMVPTAFYAFAFGGPWVLISAYFAVEKLCDHYFSKSIQTSTADMPIKKAYGCMAASIVLETLVLWSIRCKHRFPYTFRWSSLMMACAVCIVSVAWASVNIKDTCVSRNAIIKRRGHNIAASLIAAKACSICQTCLTSLDMESSFGD